MGERKKMIKILVVFSILAVLNPTVATVAPSPIGRGRTSSSLPIGEGRGGVGVHAFHTSLTEIQYNSKEKSLEISIRMFTDDLEMALTKANNGQKIMIGGKNDNSEAVLNKYIQQHFAIITPQKQKKTLTVLGKEIEGDATWVYVEIPNSQDLKGHILYNNLMQELFDDQTNLVNFVYLGNKKTYLFNAKTRSVEID
jgi:hypothetical protein